METEVIGKTVKQKGINTFIVEEHNDALHYILRSIGSKQIKFDDNVLLHFDSHPDLITENILDKDVFKPDILMEKVSIESWIIPLIYAGHFSRIIWIKSWWCNQISDQCSEIYVGEHIETGQLRIYSNISYFIGGCLCSPLKYLKNIKKFTLHVITLSSDLAIFSDIVKIINENQNYVLDVDLDFFSTKNPFIDIYSKVNTYERLKEIYKLDLKCLYIENPNEIDIENIMKERENQISALQLLFTDIHDCSDNISNVVDDILLKSNINPTVKDKLKSLIIDIRDNYDEIDWMYIHDAGTTFDEDDKELPHHISTKEEINELFDQFKLFLSLLHPPKLITIARSSVDDYCPAHQVEFIQNLVRHYCEATYKSKIHLTYL